MAAGRDRRRPAPGRFLGRLLLAVPDTYAALLVLYLLLRVLSGDRLWPVALLSTFLHWALLPSFVLLPAMIWARRWPTAAMLGMNVVLFLGLFGGLFLPPAPGPADSYDLTVMTCNLENDSTEPDALVAALRSLEADVVALQELTVEQAAAIERDLQESYPYQALYGAGIPGKGLLSRYPILEETLFYLQAQRLPYLRATLAVEGAVTPVTVIVAQPPPPHLVGASYRIPPGAAAEIGSLAEMSAAGGPVVLLGDFNMTDQNDNYALLAEAGLTDAFRAVGQGFGTTWPARGIGPLRRLVRIDYVWHSAHFRAVAAWVGPDVGSDHLPVLARLAWRRE